MNYTEILAALNKASLFDLHRLSAAIDLELSDSQRIKALARQVNVGQAITYFEPTINGLVDAVVIKIMKTRCLVQNTADGKRWTIPFYFINLEGIDVDIYPASQQRGIPKQALKVGERVGFKNKSDEDTYGEVVRLNPKTATIIVEPNHKWRVPYSLLFSVLDGEQGRDGEILELGGDDIELASSSTKKIT